MQIASTQRARLFVDGVGTTITADVCRRSADGLVVTQALPFLRLDTAVTGDDGQRARIAHVAIAMDGDVPRLSIELRHEPELEGFAEVRSSEDDTLIGFPIGVSTRPARTDSTVPYELHSEDTPSREIHVSDIPPPRASHEPAPRLPAPELPWHVRLWHVALGLLTTLLGRAIPALPRG